MGRFKRAPGPWLPPLPRATPRNLWLLLAGAIATQNIAVFHSSQSANTAVLAVLVWGGALVCLEDRLDQLHLRPSRTARGWAVGCCCGCCCAPLWCCNGMGCSTP